MIQFENATIGEGAFRLQNISFSVPTGAYAVLMGKTGSGKTTLLEAMCRLRPVHAGDIRLFGQSILPLTPAECGIGYVPQDLALFPQMTVREHLAFALRIRHAAKADIDTRVKELAQLLGLEALLQRSPARLSGGEAQRVALGRALSFHPRVLLLDEPLSALDEETRHSMYDLLRRVQKETGVTTIHVTHNPQEAAKLGDLMIVIEAGRVLTGSSARSS